MNRLFTLLPKVADRSVLVKFSVSFAILLSGVSAGCEQKSTMPSEERTVEILLALLGDGAEDVRGSAVESLGKIGNPSAVRRVADLLEDRSAIVRSAAARAVGRLGASAAGEVMPRILRALNDPSEDVRRSAAEALDELEPSSQLLNGLPNLLCSSNVEVRRTAVLALFQVDPSPWLDSIRQAAQDPDSRVRQGAVAVLGEIGTARVFASLRERVTRDLDPGVRAEAAYRLATGDFSQETRLLLKRVAEADENPTVRRWAQAGFSR